MLSVVMQSCLSGVDFIGDFGWGTEGVAGSDGLAKCTVEARNCPSAIPFIRSHLVCIPGSASMSPPSSPLSITLGNILRSLQSISTLTWHNHTHPKSTERPPVPGDTSMWLSLFIAKVCSRVPSSSSAESYQLGILFLGELRSCPIVVKTHSPFCQ